MILFRQGYYFLAFDFLGMGGVSVWEGLFVSQKWQWLKIKELGLRRFWSMFHLPGLHFGTGFWSLSGFHFPQPGFTPQEFVQDENAKLGIAKGIAQMAQAKEVPMSSNRLSTQPAPLPAKKNNGKG